MPISVNWATKVITVPQSYLTNLGGGVYQLDTNQFRADLKDLEDNPEGIPHLDTHRHNTTVTLAGITLAHVFEIINGYTVTFEDGQYAVNLIGSNNNISEVTNVNQVSIRSFNSAGLSDPGFTQADVALLTAVAANKMITDPVTGILTIYDDDGTTVLYTAQLYEGTTTAQTYRGQGAERREALS